MASLEEIERKQNAMKPLIEELANETIPDRVQQLGMQIAQMGMQIAQMAQELACIADGLQRIYAQPNGGTGTRSRTGGAAIFNSFRNEFSGR